MGKAELYLEHQCLVKTAIVVIFLCAVKSVYLNIAQKYLNSTLPEVCHCHHLRHGLKRLEFSDDLKVFRKCVWTGLFLEVKVFDNVKQTEGAARLEKPADFLIQTPI